MICSPSTPGPETMEGCRTSSRQAALASVALVLLSSCIAACTAPPSPVEPCRDCNVVLISVDTLRADHVGAYGYPRPTTPNIDALARRGVVFENAVAQSSWTRPAHMSIFTGLNPREHGFVSLADTRRLEGSTPTLAAVLRENGYATAGFSGGINMAASYGFDVGFDFYRNNGWYFRDNLEDARYWLDAHQDRKFFLFFHGYDAHTPYRSDAVDRRALGRSADSSSRRMKPACRSKDRARLARFVDEYDAAIHRADRYVGKILEELSNRHLLEKSVVVLLSDHGEEFLEHGRCFHVSTLYQEVLRVPLVIVAPGLSPRRVPELVAASVTIAPTILDLVGIVARPFPGPSLAAAAAGGHTPKDAVVSETERSTQQRGDGHVRAMTQQLRKFIVWKEPARSAVFDLQADPEEGSPLPDSRAREQAESILQDWAADHPPRFASRRLDAGADPKAPSASPAGDAESEQRRREADLKSLGYAQ